MWSYVCVVCACDCKVEKDSTLYPILQTSNVNRWLTLQMAVSQTTLNSTHKQTTLATLGLSLLETTVVSVKKMQSGLGRNPYVSLTYKYSYRKCAPVLTHLLIYRKCAPVLTHFFICMKKSAESMDSLMHQPCYCIWLCAVSFQAKLLSKRSYTCNHIPFFSQTQVVVLKR